MRKEASTSTSIYHAVTVLVTALLVTVLLRFREARQAGNDENHFLHAGIVLHQLRPARFPYNL